MCVERGGRGGGCRPGCLTRGCTSFQRSEEEPVPEELERKLREKALRSLNKVRGSTEESAATLYVN